MCINDNIQSDTKHFKKYDSIENHYQEGFIDRVKQLFVPQNGVTRRNSWFVTEKIHGCNVQISYDGKQIRYGSRNNYLQDDDKFYNYKEVLGKYKTHIKDLYEVQKASTFGDTKEVILFGELFGGEYLHSEVQKVKDASKVQKGVQYTPDNNVLFFDIGVITSKNKFYYSNGIAFLSVCQQCNIPHVPVLAINLTLDEALKYPNDGNSIVHQMYNLPPLENNIMEGIVIRGYQQEYVLSNGTRCIIKSKNDKFKEKSRKPKNVPNDIPENIQVVLNKLTPYVTPQRVENIISHFGEVDVKDIGKIIGETNKDVLQDFEKEHNDFNTLEKSEIKCVTRLLNPLVAKEVKEVIYKRINENG